jgi:hypothetical protein
MMDKHDFIELGDAGTVDVDLLMEQRETLSYLIEAMQNSNSDFIEGFFGLDRDQALDANDILI